MYMKSEIAQLYVTALANGAWSADFTCLFESSLTSRARLNVAAFLYAAREEVTRQRLAAPEPPMFAGPPMPPMPPFGTGFNFRPPAPMNWNPGPAPFNPPRASFPRHVSLLFPPGPCCTLQAYRPIVTLLCRSCGSSVADPEPWGSAQEAHPERGRWRPPRPSVRRPILLWSAAQPPSSGPFFRTPGWPCPCLSLPRAPPRCAEGSLR